MDIGLFITARNDRISLVMYFIPSATKYSNVKNMDLITYLYHLKKTLTVQVFRKENISVKMLGYWLLKNTVET